MDVKWKDGKGNVLNANKDRIIYLYSDNKVKTIIRNDEIKKITLIDGLMHIFGDFEDDLILTIIIPKKHSRNATKIYNEYDKTGEMLKGKTGNFLLDLILESSVILGNPLIGITATIGIFLILLRVLEYFIGDIVLILARVLIIGYLIFSVMTYALVRIKRKKLKEI